MAAAAVALARGLPIDAVRSGLKSFAGVPHRLEEVAVRDGVTYVNDSKATNVAAALVALASFDVGVHAIMGGQGKAEDYSPLRDAVARHCAGVYLIGAEALALRAVLDGAAPLHDCETLARAVAAARAAAKPGEVVLLSPACASYDQFDNFEARGEAFGSWRELRPDGSPPPSPPDRAQHLDHRHPLPLGSRGGDGVLRLVRTHAALRAG